MTGISIQIIVGETGPSHEPRSLSNNLGIIAIRVTINTVEHFSITEFSLFLNLAHSKVWKLTRSLHQRCFREGHSDKKCQTCRVSRSRVFIRGQSPEISLRLSVLISLYRFVNFRASHAKVTRPTYFALVIDTIAINIHIGNPNKGSALSSLLIVTRLRYPESSEVNVPR